jgi:hypothetical protein
VIGESSIVSFQPGINKARASGLHQRCHGLAAGYLLVFHDF